MCRASGGERVLWWRISLLSVLVGVAALARAGQEDGEDFDLLLERERSGGESSRDGRALPRNGGAGEEVLVVSDGSSSDVRSSSSSGDSEEHRRQLSPSAHAPFLPRLELYPSTCELDGDFYPSATFYVIKCPYEQNSVTISFGPTAMPNSVILNQFLIAVAPAAGITIDLAAEAKVPTMQKVGGGRDHHRPGGRG